MSTYKLIVPLKDQTGRQHTELTIKPTMKTRDVMVANEHGGKDAMKVGAHLMAIMAGVAFEDILEADIRDFDALDTLLTDMRFPPVPKAPEEKASDADSSKPVTESSPTSKT